MSRVSHEPQSEVRTVTDCYKDFVEAPRILKSGKIQGAWASLSVSTIISMLLNKVSSHAEGVLCLLQFKDLTAHGTWHLKLIPPRRPAVVRLLTPGSMT